MTTAQNAEMHDIILYPGESRNREKIEQPDSPNQSLKRDLNGYKRMYKMRRKNEARLLNHILNQTDAIVIVNKNGITRFVNPAAEALW